MSHSRAEIISRTCPRCGQSFQGEIWVIVDVQERPDLMERIREGALHAVTCPHCGQTEDIDAPLLLFFPDVPLKLGDWETHLLFSPARGTSQAEDEEHARALLARLREALGPAWRDEWLAQGLLVVPREMLPLLLSDDPEAALRQAAERAAAELERLRREQPDAYQRLEEAARRKEERPDLREKLEEDLVWAGGWAVPPQFQSRIQTLLALQQQAENNPGLWPQVLEGWRALIAEAESAGQRDVSALAKGNFGNGCIRLYELTGGETWAHRAEQLLREVEDVFPQTREPHIWVAVQHSLGTLSYRRYERSRDEAHAQRAEERYREVVDFHEQRRLPTVFPFRAYWALAHLEFQRGNWRECASAASSAQSLLETLLSLQAFRAGKEGWLREAQGLPTWAAFARLRLGEAMQALEALEAGRAQLLREALERSRQDLKRLPELGFRDLYERFARAAAEEERLVNLPLGARPPDWTDQLESARRELLKAAEAIRREAGAHFPEYRFFLRPLPFEEICRQAADAPLVYLAATEYGGFALIVRPEGEPLAVELPWLTTNSLQKALLGLSP
ncbi:MAG: CpXC domain-containing protein [Anaerolineae bacterium]|nr:CpXC domain-containing protein [Anaerolineae bacterium]